MRRERLRGSVARGEDDKSGAKTPVPEAGDAKGKRRGPPRWTLAVVSVAALVALVATSDRGRAPTDALEECEDYVATLKRCFGEEAALRAPPPPSTKPERAAAAKRCAADRARIERACR